jgi:uncharacterized membrane protein
MPISCTQCGAQMPENSVYCPDCGYAISVTTTSLGTTGGIRDNIAGALAYVILVPALIFLLVEPYKKNRFIRFHSWQSVFLGITVFFIGLLLLTMLGHLIMMLLLVVFLLGCSILWVLLLVKALQGEKFKIPLLGDLAEKTANAA